MRDFFVTTMSFAAPFVSDPGHQYVSAENARDALLSAVASYQHPVGLYAASVYETSDDMNRKRPPLHTWLCNLEQEKRRITKDLGSYTYCGRGGGVIEVDGVRHEIANYRDGGIVP